MRTLGHPHPQSCPFTGYRDLCVRGAPTQAQKTPSLLPSQPLLQLGHPCAPTCCAQGELCSSGGSTSSSVGPIAVPRAVIELQCISLLVLFEVVGVPHELSASGQGYTADGLLLPVPTNCVYLVAAVSPHHRRLRRLVMGTPRGSVVSASPLHRPSTAQVSSSVCWPRRSTGWQWAGSCGWAPVPRQREHRVLRP